MRVRVRVCVCARSRLSSIQRALQRPVVLASLRKVNSHWCRRVQRWTHNGNDTAGSRLLGPPPPSVPPEAGPSYFTHAGQEHRCRRDRPTVVTHSVTWVWPAVTGEPWGPEAGAQTCQGWEPSGGFLSRFLATLGCRGNASFWTVYT